MGNTPLEVIPVQPHVEVEQKPGGGCKIICPTLYKSNKNKTLGPYPGQSNL